MSYEDSISPEFYELRARGDLQARVAQRRPGRAAPAQGQLLHQGARGRPNTSVVIVRDLDGEVRAFHNICRHRGNKLVWTDFPTEEIERQLPRSSRASTTAGSTTSTARCTFVQQESEFFDFDKADYGLVPVHCDVWSGFIFVNLAEEPSQIAARLPRADDHRARRLPVRPADRALLLPHDDRQQLEALHGRLPGVLPRTRSAREAVAGTSRCPRRRPASRRCTTRSTARTAWSRTSGVRVWRDADAEMLKPMESVTRSGLFGPWDAPDLGVDAVPGVNPGEAASTGGSTRSRSGRTS